MSEDLTLHTNLKNIYVRNIPGRASKRISFFGRLSVPSGAISSGLHVLSADGSKCEPLCNIPLKISCAGMMLVLVVAGFWYDLSKHYGWWPMIGWSFVIPMTYRYILALDDADARLSHSPILLPTLLVSAELSVSGQYGIGITFVASYARTVAPLRQFLRALGIASSVTSFANVCCLHAMNLMSAVESDNSPFWCCVWYHSADSITWIQLGADLEHSTLHVFVIQSAQDARLYLQSYAGNFCDRQMLVVDEELHEVLECHREKHTQTPQAFLSRGSCLMLSAGLVRIHQAWAFIFPSFH